MSVADKAGNRSQRTRRFVLDTTAPDVEFDSPTRNSFIAERAPLLRLSWADAQGAGVDPLSVRVFLRRGDAPEIDITGSLEIDGNGASGQVPDSAALQDGTWTLRVRVADLAGNERSLEASFEIDTVAPTCVVEVPARTAVLGTTSPAFDIRYSDDRSGIDRARLALRIDGVERTQHLVWEAGRATGSLTGDDALAQGAHTAEVDVFDRAGNPAVLLPVAFRVDTIAPLAGIEQPAANSFVATASPQLRATFADTGDAPSGIDVGSVRLELDGVDHTADTQVGSDLLSGVLGPLADGPHAVVLRAADLGGNTVTATAAFVVDTQPPAVRELSLADEAWVAQLDPEGRLAISGQLQDLDSRLSVQCTVGETSVAATVSGGGFSCSVPLSEGAQTVELEVTDGGGHTTKVTRRVTVDSTPPAVHIVDPPDASYTNASSVTVTGTVVDRSPVQVSVSGVPALVSGQSFVATGVPIGDGARAVLTATATDEARNASHHEIVLHVDRVPPVVRITSPSPGEVLPGASLTVAGTYQDDSPVSIVYVNGEPAALQAESATQGRFSATVSAADGSSLLEAAAHDAAGNVGTDSVPVLVDSIPPALSISEPVSGTVTNARVIHVAGRATDETRVTVQIAGQPVSVGADGWFAADVPAAGEDGEQVITTTASDAAGNAASVDAKVTIDRTPPELVVVSPAGGLIGSLPVLVQGTVADRTSVSVTVDGRAAAVTGAAWTVAFESLEEGAHTFEIVATDAAGNLTSRSVPVQLDLSPPTIHIDQPAAAAATREATRGGRRDGDATRSQCSRQRSAGRGGGRAVQCDGAARGRRQHDRGRRAAAGKPANGRGHDHRHAR